MLRHKIDTRGYSKSQLLGLGTKISNTSLKSLKIFCRQCLQALSIESYCSNAKIDVNAVDKVVYCGNSDVIYIWTKDLFSTQLLSETLTHWLFNNDPLFKGSTLDDSLKDENIYIIELNFMDKCIIKRNKLLEINTIIV